MPRNGCLASIDGKNASSGEHFGDARLGSTILRMLRRILITVVVTLAVIFATGYWIAPIALSFYAARKASQFERIVPSDLRDQAVSQAKGKKVSYVGYQFEVPWGDLDETQTKLYPADKPDKRMADLHFRSGLRIMVNAVPPLSMVNELATDLSVSPQRIQANFGESDYRMFGTLYEFTPDKMHHWSLSQRVQAREQFLLLLKLMVVSSAAKTGIFNVGNQTYRGFQQGDPLARQDGIEMHLFSDEGSVEMRFFQKDYKNSAGVTQPEINRIIQTLRKTAPDAAAAQALAQK